MVSKETGNAYRTNLGMKIWHITRVGNVQLLLGVPMPHCPQVTYNSPRVSVSISKSGAKVVRIVRRKIVR